MMGQVYTATLLARLLSPEIVQRIESGCPPTDLAGLFADQLCRGLPFRQMACRQRFAHCLMVVDHCGFVSTVHKLPLRARREPILDGAAGWESSPVTTSSTSFMFLSQCSLSSAVTGVFGTYKPRSITERST